MIFTIINLNYTIIGIRIFQNIIQKIGKQTVIKNFSRIQFSMYKKVQSQQVCNTAVNLFGALNINGKSVVYPIGNLKKESFAEVLVKLRKDFTEDSNTIELLNDISDNLILSKKRNT